MHREMLAITAMTLLAISSSWAASCRTETLAESTPTSRFTNTAEVVTDQETTLSWMRCAVGQAWDGKSCNGEPRTLDWQQAMALVEKINAEGVGGHHDWRMPVVPELASIVERQCFNPRMNSSVFPGAPSVIFWSSMEKMGKSGYAYTLNFGAGEAVATAKDQQGAVRLVRGGPWWVPPQMTQR